MVNSKGLFLPRRDLHWDGKIEITISGQRKSEEALMQGLLSDVICLYVTEYDYYSIIINNIHGKYIPYSLE
jgi:hypothetical protein